MSVENESIVDADNDEQFENEDTSASDLPVKPWNPKDIRITTKTYTIREIYTQIMESDLDLAPDFQRAFVWKYRQQVRLVESILLGIPLPAFYLNQDETGAHQVIDGVQRLTTIRNFMSGDLILGEHLEYLSALNGLSFSTLDPAIRRRFNGTQIVAHVIEPQTPDDVKYDIFNRVNTGGSPLTAQEIRHCMSKSRSRDFLRSLVELPSFDAVMGRTFWSRDFQGEWVRDNRRMLDRELALRFCAFREVSLADYANAVSLDAFLLEFTRRIDRQPTSDLNLPAMRAAFDRAMQNCHAILGRFAFRRWPPGATRRGPLNRAIFESQALAVAQYPLPELLPRKDQIENAFRSLFTQMDYDNSVRTGTGDYRKVDLRMALPKAKLDKILT
jgi:hypothetical protein